MMHAQNTHAKILDIYTPMVLELYSLEDCVPLCMVLADFPTGEIQPLHEETLVGSYCSQCLPLSGLCPSHTF